MQIIDAGQIHILCVPVSHSTAKAEEHVRVHIYCTIACTMSDTGLAYGHLVLTHHAKRLRHIPKYKYDVLTPGIAAPFLASVRLSRLESFCRFHACDNSSGNASTLFKLNGKNKFEFNWLTCILLHF